MTAENNFKVELGAGLEDFVAAGDETTAKLLKSNDTLIAAIKRYDSFFRSGHWKPHNAQIVAVLLHMHAYMLFLSAVRIALTGHPAAVFPLLRTSLEAACYGFIIARDPNYGTIWIERHKSDKHREACKKAFSVSQAILKMDNITHLGGNVRDAYQASIDWGAHPNPRGILCHMSFDDDKDDEYSSWNLTSLYGPGRQTSGGLMACLDFGLIIASIFVVSADTPSDAVLAELEELNTLKEAVAGSLLVEEEKP